MSNSSQSNRLLEQGGYPNVNDTTSIVDDVDVTTPSATSLPSKINPRNRRYTIPRDEYCVIEDPDDGLKSDEGAINETIQIIDKDVDEISSLSSSLSSSPSISYLLELAQEMIAKYPAVDKLTELVAEDYLGYISKRLEEEEPPVSPLFLSSWIQTTANISRMLQILTDLQTQSSDEDHGQVDDDEEEKEDMQYES